jgi:hypothetical protein
MKKQQGYFEKFIDFSRVISIVLKYRYAQTNNPNKK